MDRMTPPEGCNPYREQIGAFLLGKLDGGELEAMQAHLDGCPVCRAEVRELEPVVAALADADPDRIAGDPRPPGDLEESPSAPILGEIHRAHSRRRGYGWAAVAAAAVFVVSMGLAGASWRLVQNEPIGSSGSPVPSELSDEAPGPDNVAHKKPKAAGPGGGTPPNESSPVSDIKGSSPGGAKPGAAPEISEPDRGLDEPPASVSPASSPPASSPPASSPPASVPPASSPPASVSPASVSPASAPPASSPPASSPPASSAPASSAPASAPPASAPPASSPPGQDQYKAQP